MKKNEFDFMIELKVLIHKTSVDLKLLHLKIWVKNQQKKRDPEEISPLFDKITEVVGLLFAGEKILITKKLNKEKVDALHFGHPGSTIMLTEGNLFRWSGVRKDIENKCSTCSACVSSGKNLESQFSSTEKIKGPVLTYLAKRYKLIFVVHVTTEPYICIRIDWCSIWPVV